MCIWRVGSVQLEKKWLRYYLLRSMKPQCGYGICVTCGSDAAFIPEITLSEVEVMQLLEVMVRGRVTPVTARDIVEDWLCG